MDSDAITPTRHEKLFEQYVKALREAHKDAEAWWSELRRAAGSSSERVSIERRWPVGPAAHPRVVGVIRHYYKACERLNEEIALERSRKPGDDEQEREVYPQVFIAEWLMGGENDDLGEFIDHLTYWPIGRDPDTNRPI